MINSGYNSVPVIPVAILEFAGTKIMILAGSTTKIPFRGIPGMAQILVDSSRNTRRTVKNSGNLTRKFKSDMYLFPREESSLGVVPRYMNEMK